MIFDYFGLYRISCPRRSMMLAIALYAALYVRFNMSFYHITLPISIRHLSPASNYSLLLRYYWPLSHRMYYSTASKK